MKKTIAVLLALFMLISLAACGGTVAPTTAGSTAPTTATPTTVQEDPYEIILELVNYGMEIPDLALIEEKVNAIILPEINCTIKFKTVAVADQFMKLSLWVAGDEKVDLAMTGITTNPGNLVAQGCLMPITQYINDSKILTDLAGDYLAACTFNNEIYAYPGILYPAQGISFLYRSDLAAEYNITVPKHIANTSELETVFAAVKASGMPQFAISMGNGKNATKTFLQNSFDPLNDDSYITNGGIMNGDAANKIINIFASDLYRTKVLELREWYNKGYVDTGSYSNNYATHDSIANDTAFGFLCPIGAGSNVAYWNGSTGKPLAECTIGDKTVTAGGVVNMSWGIPTTCENPAAVIKFMEVMFTNADVANLLNYGIEGKHYERVEGTEQIIKYPEGLNAFNAGYGTFINWYGDTKKTWHMQPLTDDFVASLDSLTKAGGAIMSASFGYSFDSSKVTTELSALTAVIDEFRGPLEVGVVEDVDAQLEKFIKALQDAGIDKVIAENQAQFDAWAKK